MNSLLCIGHVIWFFSNPQVGLESWITYKIHFGCRVLVTTNFLVSFSHFHFKTFSLSGLISCPPKPNNDFVSDCSDLLLLITGCPCNINVLISLYLNLDIHGRERQSKQHSCLISIHHCQISKVPIMLLPYYFTNSCQIFFSVFSLKQSILLGGGIRPCIYLFIY